VSDVNEPREPSGDGSGPGETGDAGTGASAADRISAAAGASTAAGAPAGAAPAAGASLREIYLRRLSECGFRSDASQLAAVGKLDDLRNRLVAAHSASVSSPLRRWLGSLVGGSASQPERGLYLWGGVGRGKTWLMDMFFESLPFPEKRRRHFHRFMHDVHTELKGLQNRESPLESVAEQIARDARVLCFDELFVADIADAMILGGLFEALFKRGVTLVATSNVPPQDLYKDGLQRQRFLPAIDLIGRHVDVVNVDGTTDYRLRQLTQAGTYLLSAAPDTPQRLDTLFVELAHYGSSTGGTIEIEGRTIPVVRQSSSAVWFEFDAVCGGPRSQDDYIEIAREYQSVIVADVPVLDSLRENQARRFIALVDELYDRNVNLIVSAAAPPVELYRGDRLSFQFERTVSRLIEMQSEDYLAREHRP
jgi:cell division protein ZapE